MADASPGFVHLHNHTTYSLLDGAQKTRRDVRARRRRTGSRVPGDHRSRQPVRGPRWPSGRRPPSTASSPIVGIEAYIAAGFAAFERKGIQIVAGLDRKNYYHLILLAENYTGYKNLIKLATAGYLEGFYYRPRIDKETAARALARAWSACRPAWPARSPPT